MTNKEQTSKENQEHDDWKLEGPSTYAVKYSIRWSKRCSRNTEYPDEED